MSAGDTRSTAQRPAPCDRVPHAIGYTRGARTPPGAGDILTDSADTNSTQTDSTQAELVQTEPVQTEPAESGAAQTEPAQTEPAGSGAAETESVPTEPVEAGSAPAQLRAELVDVSDRGQLPQREVLYRTWRPRRFADVVGQDPVTTTLRNAVAAGAPAHAYLFSGPRGTGKTSTGRILAKAVNCEAPAAGEADDECPSCLAFNRGQALDLIELDAASNRGIDEIRQLRESTGYAPNLARYKVYLIDEVHMLTEPAFNALLKTLEEPPPHVIFVLATTEPHKIPATILSRCQRFDFRRISLTVAVERLRAIVEGEGLTVADGGLDLIARQATGSLRDAINLLDQLVAYHGRDLTIDAVRSGLGLVVDDRAGEVARAAITRDLARGLELLAGVRDDGIEVRAFVREVVSTLRNVLMLKAGAGDQLGLADTEREALDALAGDRAAGAGSARHRRLAARLRGYRIQGRRIRLVAGGDCLRLPGRRARG